MTTDYFTLEATFGTGTNLLPTTWDAIETTFPLTSLALLLLITIALFLITYTTRYYPEESQTSASAHS